MGQRGMPGVPGTQGLSGLQGLPGAFGKTGDPVSLCELNKVCKVEQQMVVCGVDRFDLM